MPAKAGIMPGTQAPITVEQLMQMNPYNPEILPDLEGYVHEQVSSIVPFSSASVQNMAQNEVALTN